MKQFFFKDHRIFGFQVERYVMINVNNTAAIS